jgi:hypothetical protein
MLQTEATQQQHFERGLREVFEAGDGVLTLTVIGGRAHRCRRGG